MELDENNNVISIDGVPVEQLESETIDNTSESELPESDNTSNDNQ